MISEFIGHDLIPCSHYPSFSDFKSDLVPKQDSVYTYSGLNVYINNICASEFKRSWGGGLKSDLKKIRFEASCVNAKQDLLPNQNPSRMSCRAKNTCVYFAWKLITSTLYNAPSIVTTMHRREQTILYLRNKSCKPECVLNFNMGYRILVFCAEPEARDRIYYNPLQL